MNKILAITVDVEEWYHSLWFNVNEITNNPVNYCDKELDIVLNFFNELNISATFFVMGKIAEKKPHIIKKILKEGHEIGCHSYDHTSINKINVSSFITKTRKAQKIFYDIMGKNPFGYRAPNLMINTEIVNILEKLGFLYDSSVVPCIKIPKWYGWPSAPIVPYRPDKNDLAKQDHSRNFWEVPIAVLPGLRLPGAGGWYLRNFGCSWTKFIIQNITKRGPAVLYFHPWEISGFHKKIKGIPFHVFRNTGKYVMRSIEKIVKNSNAETMTIKELIHY